MLLAEIQPAVGGIRRLSSNVSFLRRRMGLDGMNAIARARQRRAGGEGASTKGNISLQQMMGKGTSDKVDVPHRPCHCSTTNRRMHPDSHGDPTEIHRTSLSCTMFRLPGTVTRGRYRLFSRVLGTTVYGKYVKTAPAKSECKVFLHQDTEEHPLLAELLFVQKRSNRRRW